MLKFKICDEESGKFVVLTQRQILQRSNLILKYSGSGRRLLFKCHHILNDFNVKIKKHRNKTSIVCRMCEFNRKVLKNDFSKKS